MFLYKVERITNLDYNYDQYTAAVVVANSAEEAATIDPDSGCIQKDEYNLKTWVLPENVNVTLLGNCMLDTAAGTVILAEFLNG